MYPVPPSLSSRPHCSAVSPLCLWWLAVVGGCIRGIGVLGGAGWLCETWHAYLNRFIPAPSSHCGRCTLIRCAGTRYPCMQWWVVHTKVIAILLLTYPHVFEQDCFHLVARRLANLFRVAVASTPRIPSTKAKKGEKCRRCWRHVSRYTRFFPLTDLVVRVSLFKNSLNANEFFNNIINTIYITHSELG